MNIEIERKFYVANTDRVHQELVHLISATRLVQGYLSDSKPTTRVRLDVGNKKAWLCVKGYRDKSTGGKPEFEYEIPYTDGEKLMPMAHSVITKNRYVLELNAALIRDDQLNFKQPNYLIELDVFRGNLEGLILAEIERPESIHDQQWDRMLIPSWFTTEVTGVKGWSNKALSKLKHLPAKP